MGRTACTEPQCLYSTAIPLLPLLAVQPVQRLSACTVELYLYSPMGRTACTEPQCLYSTANPLLPYGPYSLYRASVPVQYSCTSTPSMDRTTCTEPQCVNKGALYFSIPVGAPIQPHHQQGSVSFSCGIASASCCLYIMVTITIIITNKPKFYLELNKGKHCKLFVSLLASVFYVA